MLDKYRNNEFRIELNQSYPDKDVSVFLIQNDACVGWVTNEINGKWSVIISHYPRNIKDVSNADCTTFGQNDSKEKSIEALWEVKSVVYTM